MPQGPPPPQPGQTNPYFVYDLNGVLVGSIPTYGYSTSFSDVGQNAINYLLGLGGVIDPTYLSLYPQAPTQTQLTPISQNIIDWELGAVNYDGMMEAQYDVLNNGTLALNSDGGFALTDPNNPNSQLLGPSPNYGTVKVKKQLKQFNKAYFDNLLDVRIHELIPAPGSGYPKAPPTLRQVWSNKSGPGGWPSGPQILTGNRSKNDVWTEEDYYQDGLFGGSNPNAPPQVVIDSWGSPNSARWYPMPPGILVYNCVDYIRDASQFGSDSLGKYVVLNDDRPLLVADAYSFKTEEGTQQALTYSSLDNPSGVDVEVEDGLEYEWIVDGKTVSTDKWYQIIGQGRNHGNVAGDNSFDTSAINVTLIVRNSLGAVSTNIEYMVWGGSDSTGISPLDYGLNQGTMGVGNLYHGTPFWKTQAWDNQTATSAPWGEYYTFDESSATSEPGRTAGAVIVVSDNTPPPVPADYPPLIFMADSDGTYDTSRPDQVPVGINWDHSTDGIAPAGNHFEVGGGDLGNGFAPFQKDLLPTIAGGERTDFAVALPGLNNSPSLILSTLNQTGQGVYGQGLPGYLDFWKDRVWSANGFEPGTAGVTGDDQIPGVYPYTPRGVGANGYHSIWIKKPSQKDMDDYPDLKATYFVMYVGPVTLGNQANPFHISGRHLHVLVPFDIPSNNGAGTITSVDWDHNPSRIRLKATSVGPYGYVRLDLKSWSSTWGIISNQIPNGIPWSSRDKIKFGAFKHNDVIY